MPTSSNDNYAVRIRNLSKSYALKNAKGKDEKLMALNNINLDIKQGEAIGIIGPNGSGKSTLLKILSEITAPDSGSVEINGKVASILEVGTGFNPDLSGRKNIYLNARLHGMKKVEVDTKFDQIVELFGFPNFLDTPVKHYSSGMYMRLAFAVVVHIDADIYLFDEVLSVGDVEFQKKSIEYIAVMKGEGKTIFIVTHSPELILEISNHFLILKNGNVIKIGSPSETIMQYQKSIFNSIPQKNITLKADYNTILPSKKVLSKNPEFSFDLLNIRIQPPNKTTDKIYITDKVLIEFEFKSFSVKEIQIGFTFKDGSYNVPVLTTFSKLFLPTGDNQRYITEIPSNTFNLITFSLGFFVLVDNKPTINYHNILSFRYDAPNNLKQREDYFTVGIINMDLKSKICNLSNS
jgi:ABC-type polysaccharide/polyol phosphate transport system ATPase subunit